MCSRAQMMTISCGYFNALHVYIVLSCFGLLDLMFTGVVLNIFFSYRNYHAKTSHQTSMRTGLRPGLYSVLWNYLELYIELNLQKNGNHAQFGILKSATKCPGWAILFPATSIWHLSCAHSSRLTISQLFTTNLDHWVWYVLPWTLPPHSALAGGPPSRGNTNSVLQNDVMFSWSKKTTTGHPTQCHLHKRWILAKSKGKS